MQDIFDDLFSASTGSTVKRRIPTPVGIDMFFSVVGQHKGLAFDLLGPELKACAMLPEFFGLNVQQINSSKGYQLYIEPSTDGYNAIFKLLAVDLATTVCRATSVQSAIGGLESRLTTWGQCFQRVSNGALSLPQQQGLYAELRFINSLTVPKQLGIRHWVGMEPATRDFTFGNSAVEVKSCSGKEPRSIQISNEVQLDSTGLDPLLLACYVLDRAPGQGCTLPQMVESTRLLIPTADRWLFETKLFQSGYSQEHVPLYTTGFIDLEERYYRIEDLFPRLISTNIPVGVAGVRYSLMLANCEPYRINLTDLLDEITK